MDYGVHLPLIGFGGEPPTLAHLTRYAETAEKLGYAALSVNDHLLFSRPWLDGPTALSSVLAATGQMDLMTTVALPVVRGPVALAKSMAAIDILSGGRLVVGVGPGSSARDYDAVGVPFEERWKRLDEAVGALRALWCETGRRLRAITIRPKACWQSRGRYGNRVLRYGSAAGTQKPASAGRPVWATAGSPPPTTRHQKRSPTRGLDSENT
jgi:alkanesulfonate monooxygenase SsuD/methylene tetrahydromethanopterin reductase-like flavin-dependent oxidoreductase (luciferase family)